MGVIQLRDILRSVLKKSSFYFCVFFIIVNLILTKQLMAERGLHGFVGIAIVELLVECGVLSGLYYMRKKGVPLERLFLLVAIVLGMLFIIALPPGEGPDEGGHFMRAYGIQEGYFVAERIGESEAVGSPIPVEADFMLGQSGWRDEGVKVYDGVLEELARRPSGETKMQSYNTLAVYNFVCYLPQALGILIGRVLGFSVLGMAYLAKIFNFAIWVLLSYYAIKLMPKFKSVFLFIALLPITLQEATSLAPDALTIGLGMFVVAYITHLIYSRRMPITIREKILLGCIAVVISLCKIVYLPLVFLYAILPFERFGTKKKKWIFVIGIIVLAIVLNLIWLAVSFGYITETTPGVNAGAQMIGIIKHPFSYIGVMVHTIDVYSFRWINEFLGMSLGAVGFILPTFYFVTSFIICVMVFSQRDENLKVKLIERVVFVGVFLAVSILICVSLYVQWTAYDNPIIEGIQGRYFLPIVGLVPLMICRAGGKRGEKLVSNDVILKYSLFVNVMACTVILVGNMVN